MKRSHFRTLYQRLINLESMIFTSPSVSVFRYYYFCSFAVKSDFHTREISPSRFFSLLIDWFRNFLSPSMFFSERILDGRRAEKMNGRTCQNIVDSSAHCWAIFRRLQHPGGLARRGVLSGSMFRSPVRNWDGSEAGR